MLWLRYGGLSHNWKKDLTCLTFLPEDAQQHTDRASGDAEASSILHVVREAGACLGGAAEGVDAFLGADWVAETIVVDVTDVTFAAGTDAAEVSTGLRI